jgi:hypothetical protein
MLFRGSDGWTVGPAGQVIVTGALLWWITQLLPLVTGRPWNVSDGSALDRSNGGAITLRALLFRTVMLIVTISTFRFRSDLKVFYDAWSKSSGADTTKSLMRSGEVANLCHQGCSRTGPRGGPHHVAAASASIGLASMRP